MQDGFDPSKWCMSHKFNTELSLVVYSIYKMGSRNSCFGCDTLNQIS